MSSTISVAARLRWTHSPAELTALAGELVRRRRPVRARPPAPWPPASTGRGLDRGLGRRHLGGPGRAVAEATHAVGAHPGRGGHLLPRGRGGAGRVDRPPARWSPWRWRGDGAAARPRHGGRLRLVAAWDGALVRGARCTLADVLDRAGRAGGPGSTASAGRSETRPAGPARPPTSPRPRCSTCPARQPPSRRRFGRSLEGLGRAEHRHRGAAQGDGRAGARARPP